MGFFRMPRSRAEADEMERQWEELAETVPGIEVHRFTDQDIRMGEQTERFLQGEFERRLSEIQRHNKAKRTKPRLEDDQWARETYETGLELKRRNPRMTNAQIAANLFISRETWQRYKRRFGESATK